MKRHRSNNYIIKKIITSPQRPPLQPYDPQAYSKHPSKTLIITYNEIAMSSINKGDFEAATRELEQAEIFLDKLPLSNHDCQWLKALTLNNAALLRLYNQQYDKAQELLTKAVKLDSQQDIDSLSCLRTHLNLIVFNLSVKRQATNPNFNYKCRIDNACQSAMNVLRRLEVIGRNQVIEKLPKDYLQVTSHSIMLILGALHSISVPPILRNLVVRAHELCVAILGEKHGMSTRTGLLLQKKYSLTKSRSSTVFKKQQRVKSPLSDYAARINRQIPTVAGQQIETRQGQKPNFNRPPLPSKTHNRNGHSRVSTHLLAKELQPQDNMRKFSIRGASEIYQKAMFHSPAQVIQSYQEQEEENEETDEMEEQLEKIKRLYAPLRKQQPVQYSQEPNLLQKTLHFEFQMIPINNSIFAQPNQQVGYAASNRSFSLKEGKAERNSVTPNLESAQLHSMVNKSLLVSKSSGRVISGSGRAHQKLRYDVAYSENYINPTQLGYSDSVIQQTDSRRYVEGQNDSQRNSELFRKKNYRIHSNFVKPQRIINSQTEDSKEESDLVSIQNSQVDRVEQPARQQVNMKKRVFSRRNLTRHQKDPNVCALI